MVLHRTSDADLIDLLTVVGGCRPCTSRAGSVDGVRPPNGADRSKSARTRIRRTRTGDGRYRWGCVLLRRTVRVAAYGRRAAFSAYLRGWGRPGMIARHVIARLLETFFRRWWLYIIPVVALLGVGVFTAGREADTYRSSAVLTASDQTLLDELQNVSRSDVLAFESPADANSETNQRGPQHRRVHPPRPRRSRRARRFAHRHDRRRPPRRVGGIRGAERAPCQRQHPRSSTRPAARPGHHRHVHQVGHRQSDQ